MNVWSSLRAGLAAGAAGTTVLNAVTYLDMVARGRPASTTPEDAVRALSDKTGVSIPATTASGRTVKAVSPRSSASPQESASPPHWA